jgi:solute carrier family 25 (mitochondrial phosphate transporter), member 23/24/25/41
MDGESQEQREERLKELWYQLDSKRTGRLDLPALKLGLAKMNHREPPVHLDSRMDTDHVM